MGFRCIFIYLVIFISFMSCELKTDTIYKYGGFLYQYESDYPDGVIFMGLEHYDSDLEFVKFDIPRYIYNQTVVGVRGLQNVKADEIYFHENIRFLDDYTSYHCESVDLADTRLTNIGPFCVCENYGNSHTLYKSDVEVVYLPNTVKYIHRDVFEFSNIKVLYLHSVVPPSTDADVIRYIRNKAIYVPKESLDAYKAHPFWGNCNNINAIE